MMDSGDFETGNPELRDATFAAMEKTGGRLTSEDPSSVINPEESTQNDQDQKRPLMDDTVLYGMEPTSKKSKVGGIDGEAMTAPAPHVRGGEDSEEKKEVNGDEIVPVPAATVGISSYGENDVLSGYVQQKKNLSSLVVTPNHPSSLTKLITRLVFFLDFFAGAVVVRMCTPAIETSGI